MIKNTKPRRRYTRLIDLILNVILLAVSVYVMYNTYQLQMLPMQWIMIGGIALAIMFLIFFVLMFMKVPKVALVIKRGCLLLLCGILLFAGYSIGNVTTAVNKVSVTETTTTIKIHVLAQKNSDIASITDFSKRSLGIQIGTDFVNTTYGKEQIAKAMSVPPTYQEELDYSQLTTLFMNQMIEGMLISQEYLDMMEANVKDFKKSYKIVSSYERQRPLNPSNNKDITKESFALLISGVDEVGAADQAHLSDVNILLFVNPISNQITMISLPRDSLMPHPVMNYANDKLTHTGSYGIDNTVQTVEEFFDIDIDYYAKVSFTSLIEIVDAIGGIDVDVEIAFEEQDENRSFEEEDLIRLQQGMQHINGKEALAYSRHRKTENYDVAGRERAQERIIKAIIDKILTPEGITLYVNRLMETVPKYVVTNMPGSQITSFIKGELQELKPWTIQSLSLENGTYDNRPVPNVAGGSSVYLWNKYDYRKLLDAYQESKKNLTFNEFKFDLADMSKYLPQISNNTRIVWDYMAVNPY